MVLLVLFGVIVVVGIGFIIMVVDVVVVYVDVVLVVVDYVLLGIVFVVVVNGDVFVGVLFFVGSLDVDVVELDFFCERGSDFFCWCGDGWSDEECGVEDGGEDGGGVEYYFDG